MTRPGILGAVAAVGAVAALALASAPVGACACGVAIDATVTEESALVVEGDGTEEIILSLDLTSDGPQRAAVVLPVPGVPEVEAVTGGDPLTYLEEATLAEPSVGATAGGGDGAPAPGVEVIDEQEIGGYRVARLEAGDAAALERWLADNDYTLPPGAEPILDSYVDEGWRFVAIRLAPEAEGRLKPLSVSFTTDEFVYPMRLDQLAPGPLTVTLFTLADGPRQTEYLSPTWGGTVAELDPPPPAGLAGLFAQGDYVTRLEASGLDPAAFEDDLVIEPTADLASDQVDVAVPEVEPEEESGISSGVVIAMIVAGAAFALALGVATRR